MIKIGDFSNLAHVSIKTLHHYDELGLLKPAYIDRFSGYRYYALQQLATLNRILALKDLGLSLEQVAQLLHDETVSTAEMRGMLRLKRMELAARVEEEQARLLRVEQRLRQLEGQDVPAEVAVKAVPAQTVLLAQVIAADESMLLRARQSLQTLLQNHLDQARLKPAGPWFGLMENLPYAEADHELTLGVPVQLRSHRADDWHGTPVSLRELPAAPNMASLVHTAEVAGLPLTYTSLYAWTQANGYKVAGLFREIYLPDSPATPSADAALIEVQCPVERAGIPLSIQTRKDEPPMQPQIITLPAFKAVGYSYIGSNSNGEISQMWDQFLPRINELKRNDAHTTYGLCLMNNPNANEGEFEYVASVEVADAENLPEGMVYREVPAYKYAVFTHHGKLDNLRDTYDYIFNTGLSQAGLQAHTNHFDMEVYKEDFEFGAENSKMYIYVALQ